MHLSAYQNMEEALLRYPKGDNLSVADIGSLQASEGMQETYRSLIEKRGWKYTGFDIQEGKNVDVLMEEYTIPRPTQFFDLVISGNTVEHVRNIFKWMNEIRRVLNSHGYAIIVAPHPSAKKHEFPVDCWRIFPEGMKALIEESKLECIYSGYGWHTETDDPENTDIVGVGKKCASSFYTNVDIETTGRLYI